MSDLADALKAWALEHDEERPTWAWLGERTEGDFYTDEDEFVVEQAVIAIRGLVEGDKELVWGALDLMLEDLTDPHQRESKSLEIGLHPSFVLAVEPLNWRGELFLQLLAWAVSGDLEQRYPLRRCRNPKCKLPGGMFAPKRSDQTVCSRACATAAHRAEKGTHR